MKITVEIDGFRHLARAPHAEADHVVLVGVPKCPKCKHEAPVKVAGAHKRIESHDTYAADATLLCCKQRVGAMRVKVDTIFGIEEDERVLNGPWRVY
jgi:hypothetical protein